MNENEVIPMKYAKNAVIAEANELIRSKQDNLTLLEAKLIRLAISQIITEDTEIYTYSCNVADLARYLGMEQDNIYREMRNFAVNLMKKTIYVKIPSDKPTPKPNYKIFHWVDTAEYNNGIITFKLSDSLKPYLVGLNQLFTLYGFSALLDMPTSNAIKLYELILSYRNMAVNHNGVMRNEYMGVKIKNGEYVFSIEYLREFFNCENKYKNTNDFLRRIIDNSIIALAKTREAIYLTYRLVKVGRKITHIVFRYHNLPDTEYKKLIAEIVK